MTAPIMSLLYFFLLLLLLAVAVAEVNELGQESYDIDSSWAIQSATLADTFGPSKHNLYKDFMDGCRAAVPANDHASCNDDFRINMNTYQPRGMRVC